VSPRASARTAPCTPADARARLRKAQSFVTGAELALGVDDDPLLDLPGVAAALAVLAGIAAADAACCAALGERSRGQAHQEAIALVRTVRPHGVQMARDLERLIQKKDNAHYGMISTTDTEAHAMIAWAQRLITCASATVAG
jgi:hypothetical protein